MLMTLVMHGTLDNLAAGSQSSKPVAGELLRWSRSIEWLRRSRDLRWMAPMIISSSLDTGRPECRSASSQGLVRPTHSSVLIDLYVEYPSGMISPGLAGRPGVLACRVRMTIERADVG
jgi:hypothetical protein